MRPGTVRAARFGLVRAVVLMVLMAAGWAPVVGAGAGGDGGQWNQFRGPNGQGVAPAAKVPTEFGSDRNVVWKTPLPPGHSSPVLWNQRLYVTAAEPTNSQDLLVIALDAAKGRERWRRTLHSESPGNFHPLNHPAASTPAVDARRVYVYFGTYGLVAYDHAGREQWQRRIDTPPSKYGMATSPILHEGHVLLALDGDKGKSRLIAFDAATGKTVWEQPRPLFRAGWATPMIFRHEGMEELIVLGSKRLTAYRPATGEELWWAAGFPDETVCVPVVTGGLLIAGGAALGGRGDDTIDAGTMWRQTLAEYDANHDGRIQRGEMTAGFAFVQRPELPKDNPGYALPVGNMDNVMKYLDHDRDGVISEQEWNESMVGFAASSHPNLAAFRPGASRDARPTHLAWEIRRGVPEVPSPVAHDGRLFLLRDGGLLTCLEAATGRELYRERLGAAGQYIASPIIAGDRLITASAEGVVCVIRVADRFELLSRQSMGEAIFATPAAAGKRLYLRTERRLYAIGR